VVDLSRMKFLAALVIGMFCFGVGYFVARSTPESEPTVSEHNQDIAVENFIQTIQQKAQTQPEDRPALQQQLLPRQVYAGQQLFAHFDTLGKTPNNEQVFVRWSNQSTGEVLFFMPQRISANREQNWVSFKPAKGWKAGSYDVKYYQLNDQLVPIAQTSFTIDQVID